MAEDGRAPDGGGLTDAPLEKDADIDASSCGLTINAARHDRVGRPMTASITGARAGTTHRWTISPSSCLAATPALDLATLTFTPVTSGCTLQISVEEDSPSCRDTAVVQVDFSDVPAVEFDPVGTPADPTEAYHPFIDTLAALAPKTTAFAPPLCAQGQFCPSSPLSRALAVAYVLAAKEGPKYTPPACDATFPFTDVDKKSPSCPWIAEAVKRSITAGCTGTSFCPDNPVTRDQMAVFLLVAKEGAGYAPPACGDVTMFADVPKSSGFCRWIEELARRKIAAGCGGGNFCPAAEVNMASLAVFAVTTFGLEFPENIP
jgi:hypothetical protein